jgi:small subunit ribosomal protein S1
VLPVRPIVPPTEGDSGDLDDVPELGLSEDVFAASDAAEESQTESPPPDEAPAADATADPELDVQSSPAEEREASDAPEDAPA